MRKYPLSLHNIEIEGRIRASKFVRIRLRVWFSKSNPVNIKVKNPSEIDIFLQYLFTKVLIDTMLTLMLEEKVNLS